MNGGDIMSAEFHPNGYIEALIEKYGPNVAEVKEAIEFWGPEAGEFIEDDTILSGDGSLASLATSTGKQGSKHH